MVSRSKPPAVIRSFAALVPLVLPMVRIALSQRAAARGSKLLPVDKPWPEAACEVPPTAQTLLYELAGPLQLVMHRAILPSLRAVVTQIRRAIVRAER